MSLTNDSAAAEAVVSYSLPDVYPGSTRRQLHYWVCALPKKLTYAALVGPNRHETEITDFMVRRGCDEAEQLQQFPFAQRL